MRRVGVDLFQRTSRLGMQLLSHGTERFFWVSVRDKFCFHLDTADKKDSLAGSRKVPRRTFSTLLAMSPYPVLVLPIDTLLRFLAVAVSLRLLPRRGRNDSQPSRIEVHGGRDGFGTSSPRRRTHGEAEVFDCTQKNGAFHGIQLRDGSREGGRLEKFDNFK